MTNPWIQPASPSDQEVSEPVAPRTRAWGAGADVRVAGGLPVVDVGDSSASFWVVGAHGGAGTTSWAHLLAAGDAGTAWPRATHAVTALVVARATYVGLRAAQLAAIQWASGMVQGVDLLGLVVGADAPGKPPKALREFTRRVEGAFPRVWTVPWVESWRAVEAWKDVPRSVVKITADIKAATAAH